jgi:hypothetical protein
MSVIKVAGNLYHTIIQCQLYRLIRALDLHHSSQGWAIVRHHLNPYLSQADVLNVPLRDVWMRPQIRYKSFIRMKLDSLYRDVSFSPMCEGEPLLIFTLVLIHNDTKRFADGIG